MPGSALQHVAVDHCLKLRDIPALLIELVGTPNPVSGGGQAAVEAGGGEITAEYRLDDPAAVTCPDCGGVLQRTQLGTLTQFRCHIGHVYTAEVVLAAQFAALEWSLQAAMRLLSERGELCRQMADKTGDAGLAAGWIAAMQEAKARTGVLRTLLEQEWTQPGDTVCLPMSGR
jgi:two-component system chemotaxis response regulator CheB